MQDLDIRGAGNLLGSEQSGFIADLGYETFLKILNEAVTELRNEARTLPQPLPEREGRRQNQGPKLSAPLSQREGLGESLFVSDCTLESDLEMYFPDQYVPSDSERMLLYRELDNLSGDDELERYRSRMLDRFGPLPKQAEELLQVVPLRRLGKQFGIEKIVLKQGRMALFFVSNADSPFYQSPAFDRILDYVGQHPRRCQLREQNGRRSLVITDMLTVRDAVTLLSEMNSSSTP
jgi:transcription-repair coupling factor (superfamily II helicase)